MRKYLSQKKFSQQQNDKIVNPYQILLKNLVRLRRFDFFKGTFSQ